MALLIHREDRARFRAAAIGLSIVLLLTALSPQPARAAVEFTSWKCTLAGCKYGQTRVKYDRVPRYWYSAQWKGGTASQTCDPSNDVTRWRMDEVEATSGLTYSWGPQTWKTNCNVNDLIYVVNVNKNWSGGLDVRFTHFHDASCAGCDFYSNTWHYG
jgi:hypothetical protein